MAKDKPPEGYRVRKVNIQDPRYGSPNYRHVAIDPKGTPVSRNGQTDPYHALSHNGAVRVAEDHLNHRQFFGRP